MIMSEKNKLTLREAMEDLHRELDEAMGNPDHPIFDKLKETLFKDRQFLDLLNVPRHQVNDHFSYVRVSDIPSYFKSQFDEFFLGKTMFFHESEPDEGLLDSKKFERFVQYIKDMRQK
ncbi:hypothetical protein ABKPCSM17A_03831 [Acinetobacter baumannii]|nr:hypothetical protein ABKPCSM17A_03831 [Acinetobacter baumannii]